MERKELEEIKRELEELRELVNILLDDYFKRNPPEEE